MAGIYQALPIDVCRQIYPVLLTSFALLVPPDDDFSRLAEGGQQPVDRVSGVGLQPAVNLIASVLNV